MSLFTPATLRFLDDLRENNNKAWFEENKLRYEADVREPARAFIRAMVPTLEALCPSFVADDRKVGGSLMRVFRDTRFSKDKTPYKTNIGVQFRHEDGADVHAPGIYLHIDSESCFLGVGSWMPEPEPLLAVRQTIVADPERAAAVIASAKGGGWTESALADAALKRVPKGFDPDHPQAELLKRKSHLLVSPLTRAEVVADDLVDQVGERLGAAIPYLRWLTEAVGARF